MLSGQEREVYDSVKGYAQKREIPAIFSSLSKDRESLVFDWHVVSYSTSKIWDPASEQIPSVPQAGAWQKKSMSILARWSSAYDVYSNIQGVNLTDKKRKGTAVFRILKELGSTVMMINRTVVDDQVNWDVFCPMFQKIVSLAEDITGPDLNPTVEEPNYCMHMAIVGTLFKVSPISNIFSPFGRSRELY